MSSAVFGTAASAMGGVLSIMVRSGTMFYRSMPYKLTRVNQLEDYTVRRRDHRIVSYDPQRKECRENA